MPEREKHMNVDASGIYVIFPIWPLSFSAFLFDSVTDFHRHIVVRKHAFRPTLVVQSH
jgi:hypothetical protein